MYKKRYSFLAFILSILMLTSTSCAQTANSVEAPIGKEAPDFTLESLRGEAVTLSSFKEEKGVLIVFGATWCPYCVKEIPELKEIFNKYKDGRIKLLYVDVQESAQKLKGFAEKHDIPYTILLDSTGAVARSYGVRGIPYQVIVNKEGKIFYEGPRPRGGLASMLLELTQK